MTPLKIVVTEAMRDTAMMAARFSYEESDEDDRAYSAAIEAVLRHPHVLAQIREQVMGCLPSEVARSERDSDVDWGYFLGYGACRSEARASLGRLLGEEGK
jgi:hypothetical protein